MHYPPTLYFHGWEDPTNHTFLLNEKKLNSSNGFPPTKLTELNNIDSIIFLAGDYANNTFPELRSDSIWSVYSNFEKSKSDGDVHFDPDDGITVSPDNECCEGFFPGGPVKITSNKPLDQSFNPPLFFMNGIKLSIPKGERLPIDVKNLEVMDSIILLTGKRATDIYGEEGENGVWLIYATNEPIDNEVVHHKFSSDEKISFEKSIQVHPNPMTDEAFISFEMMGNQNVRLQIFDEKGSLLTTIIDGTGFPDAIGTEKIVQGFAWRPTNIIPAGIYFARIQIGGEVFTKQIIKVNQ